MGKRNERHGKPKRTHRKTKTNAMGKRNERHGQTKRMPFMNSHISPERATQYRIGLQPYLWRPVPLPFPLPFAVGEWERKGGKKSTSRHTGFTPCAIICRPYRAFTLFTGQSFQRTLCQCHWRGGSYYWALMSMPICPFHLRYQLLVSSRRVRKAVSSVPLRIAIFLARYDGSLRRSATRMRS